MTVGDYGGQRANMEDTSMKGTLAAQAELVWPKERGLLARADRVLDVACGTGEILRRYRAEFVPRLAVGVDLFAGHLAHAERPVVRGDGFQLPFPGGCFDLVLVRHVLQALPDPVSLLREAHRVLRPGGRIHLLVEDYAAIHFDIDDRATVEHFREVTWPFYEKGTDLYQGRKAPRHLRAAGFSEVWVDPIVVDNQGDGREAFARVFHYWREGYAATLADLLGTTEAEMRRRFGLMIENIRDPERYAAWLLFAVSGRKLPA